VAAGAAFVRHERRTASPLVPARLLRSTAVTSALAVLLCASAALFGALFVGTYFLQDVLGLDPLDSGLRVLPLAVAMVLGAPAAAVLLRRQGPRRTVTAAMTLLALGILVLSRLDQASTAAAIGGGFLMLGAGFGTVMVAATAVVVRQASTDDAGVAGGLQQTAMNIGPTLGVAVATMLVTWTAAGAAGDRPHLAGESFTAAMSPALAVLAAVALTAALLAVRLPGRTGAGDGPVLPDTAGTGTAGRVRACRADRADGPRPESARPAGPPAPPA
jgi:predicted MFS family arabinose efflux permease